MSRLQKLRVLLNALFAGREVVLEDRRYRLDAEDNLCYVLTREFLTQPPVEELHQAHYSINALMRMLDRTADADIVVMAMETAVFGKVKG